MLWLQAVVLWLQAVVLWLHVVVLWVWLAAPVTIGANFVLMEPAAVRPHASTTIVADDQSPWATATAAMALALTKLLAISRNVPFSRPVPIRFHGWRFTRVRTKLATRRLSHALGQECLP